MVKQCKEVHSDNPITVKKSSRIHTVYVRMCITVWDNFLSEHMAN